MLAADCGTDVTPPLGPGNSDPEEAEKSLAKQVDFWSFGFFLSLMCGKMSMAPIVIPVTWINSGCWIKAVFLAYECVPSDPFSPIQKGSSAMSTD